MQTRTVDNTAVNPININIVSNTKNTLSKVVFDTKDVTSNNTIPITTVKLIYNIIYFFIYTPSYYYFSEAIINVIILAIEVIASRMVTTNSAFLCEILNFANTSALITPHNNAFVA